MPSVPCGAVILRLLRLFVSILMWWLESCEKQGVAQSALMLVFQKAHCHFVLSCNKYLLSASCLPGTRGTKGLYSGEQTRSLALWFLYLSGWRQTVNKWTSTWHADSGKCMTSAMETMKHSDVIQRDSGYFRLSDLGKSLWRGVIWSEASEMRSQPCKDLEEGHLRQR